MNQQSLLIYDAHGALKHIQRYVIFFGNKLTGSTQLPACSKFEIICRRRYIILSIMTSDVFIPKEVVKFKKSNTNIGTETCFSFKYIQLCHRNVCIIYIMCSCEFIWTVGWVFCRFIRRTTQETLENTNFPRTHKFYFSITQLSVRFSFILVR